MSRAHISTSPANTPEAAMASITLVMPSCMVTEMACTHTTPSTKPNAEHGKHTCSANGRVFTGIVSSPNSRLSTSCFEQAPKQAYSTNGMAKHARPPRPGSRYSPTMARANPTAPKGTTAATLTATVGRSHTENHTAKLISSTAEPTPHSKPDTTTNGIGAAGTILPSTEMIMAANTMSAATKRMRERRCPMENSLRARSRNTP